MNEDRQQEHGECTVAPLTHLTCRWKKSDPILLGRQRCAHAKWTLRESRKTTQQWLPVLTLLSSRLGLNSSSTTFLCDISQAT